MAETRKIAAILVADIVGYSRLAGACIEQHLIVTCRHAWRDADEQCEAV
jgi:hypothetical protein